MPDGYCEKLNRHFVDRKDLAEFCAQQALYSGYCLRCQEKGQSVEPEESRPVNLSPDTLSAVRRLVADECANHCNTGPLRTKNYCWMREKSNGGICNYFVSVVKRCKWFEVAALPLREDLKETYFEEIQKKEEVHYTS
jgi:hypothetical protein